MNSENSAWAVIPARGGSKGIKKKNIKDLGGEPLIAWAIKSLKESKVFEKIIVTSDDDEILDIASSYNIDTYKRSLNDEDSNDFTMPDIPVHTCISSYKKSQLPRFLFMIQCTSPFVDPKSYRSAYMKLTELKNSTVFSVKNSHSFIWIDKNKAGGVVNPLGHPFDQRLGRQYLPDQQYTETGGFYGFPLDLFMSSKHRFINSAFPIVVSDLEALDLDTYDDWKLAEYYVNIGNKDEN